MVYKENFVVSIRVVGGKKDQILREYDGTVRLPFGSEYSIYMKNTNSTRAVVTILIDGKSIGDDIVINAHSSLDLERFIDKSMQKGRRFRFIEKTNKISEYRGDRIEDGLIEVRYRFEKSKICKGIRGGNIYHHHHHHYPDPYTPNPWPSRPVWITEPSFTTCDVNSHNNELCMSSNCCFNLDSDGSRGFNEEGITVEGSDSNQIFQFVNIGELESQEHCITIKLVGEDPSTRVKISSPVTVKMTCPTCGNTTRGRFCDGCGTRVRD